jgi:hypothetical protein
MIRDATSGLKGISDILKNQPTPPTTTDSGTDADTDTDD